MKALSCPDCDKMYEAETPEALLEAMHPHYMEDHKDIIASASPEKKEAWMKQFYADWEAAEEK